MQILGKGGERKWILPVHGTYSSSQDSRPYYILVDEIKITITTLNLSQFIRTQGQYGDMLIRYKII